MYTEAWCYMPTQSSIMCCKFCFHWNQMYHRFNSGRKTQLSFTSISSLEAKLIYTLKFMLPKIRTTKLEAKVCVTKITSPFRKQNSFTKNHVQISEAKLAENKNHVSILEAKIVYAKITSRFRKQSLNKTHFFDSDAQSHIVLKSSAKYQH